MQAAKRKRLKAIPVLFTGDNEVEISIVENLLREKPTPIEAAEALQWLVDFHGYRQNQLTAIFGKAESTVSEMLSLNQLPDKIKEECRNSSEYSRGMFLKIIREHKQSGARIRAFEKLKAEKEKETKARRRNAEIFLSGIRMFSDNLDVWSKKGMAQNELLEVRSALFELVGKIEKILVK